MKKLYFIILPMLIVLQLKSQSSIEMATYGTTAAFDSTCTSLPYDGSNENLIIPVQFHVSNSNVQADISKIGLLLLLANIQFSSNGVPIEFKNVQTIANHSSISVDYCQFDPNSGDCDCSIFGGSSYLDVLNIANQNSEVLNIFIFEKLYFEKDTSDVPCSSTIDDYSIVDGNAYYPNTILPPNGANNYLLIENDVLNNTFGTILAHELGHLLGLYHTFESSAFPGNSCTDYDGIEDTGDQNNNCFDDNTASTVTCNLMDYGGLNIPPWNGCPGIWNITQCQKSKVLDILFSCRNNLCSNPIKPDIQTTDGLSAFQLNYIRGDQLDTLISVLDNTTGTNSGNFALFRLKESSGLLLDTYFADSLDLNTVFDGVNHPNHGVFTIEAIDSSLYNPNCKSAPTIIDIFIAPCNNDNICDLEEECQDCDDCIVDLENGLVAYYPFNGNTNDESGNGHHGTVYGATLTTDRIGNIDAAYIFDGLNDSINVFNPFGAIVTDSDTLGLSVWIKTNTNKSDATICSYYSLCQSGAGGGDDDYFILYLKNGTDLSYSNGNGGIANVIIPNLNDDTWQHISLNYVGSDVIIYLNGDEVLNSAMPPSSDPVPDFYNLVIGDAHINNCGNNILFEGKIDDIRIFDRILNCNEIDSLYNQGCILHKLVQYQTFNIDTTIYARELIELDNVSVNAPFELTLKSPEVFVENNCQVNQGAKLTVINEDGCIQN